MLLNFYTRFGSRAGFAGLLLSLAACAAGAPTDPGSGGSGGDGGGNGDGGSGDGGSGDGGGAAFPEDLGEPCGGGCAGADICTVSDPACSSGHCLFDGRGATSKVYCTADCSAASCPTGFVCEDVPFQLERACVIDPAAPPAGDSSVIGAMTVDGKGASPPPFHVDQSFDGPLASDPLSLECGRVGVEWEPWYNGAEAMLKLSVKACTGAAYAYFTVSFPPAEGSYPAKNPDVPKPNASVDADGPMVYYGKQDEYQSLEVVGVLEISEVLGAQNADWASSKYPWTGERLRVKYTGTLPSSTVNYPDSSIDVQFDLELVNVFD